MAASTILAGILANDKDHNYTREQKVGEALCLAQMQFGFVKLGHSEGSYIVDAYPVSVHATDLLIIFATVLVVGLIAVWIPVRRMTRSLLTTTTQPQA